MACWTGAGYKIAGVGQDFTNSYGAGADKKDSTRTGLHCRNTAELEKSSAGQWW